ncbi:putative lipid II flippase FtsW [Alkalihalobacillus sp. BA299]|uniref:putative lipid II flippase FtsW n=1 Tax=Alkalihalobacillus sp. BA299 TaxID=2815938 RepID=UPI001ADCE542|nr:putative lipid II flippase FtsW [Alkalihalobacillus sp. BA299]
MKYSFTKDNDWLLIVVTFLLAIFGLIMVFSSSYVWALYTFGDYYFFVKRQAVWLGIGVFLFFIVMHFPFRLYRKISPMIILGSVIILTLVLLIGLDVNGAQRWIKIGPFTLQPSEFVKLGMIIYLASVYSQKQAYINQFIKGVMPPLIVVTIILGLIVRQPDLGTATSILLVTILIVFFSGAKIKHLLFLGLSGAAVFVLAVLAAPYRMKRITSFMDPFAYASGDGYQILQSYIAIAHGGLSGAGLGQSVQKLMYLPEPQTDFILAIISEELGLIGVAFVFLCYTILFIKGVVIGIRCKNAFGSLLAFGIVFQFGIQIVFNIGAVSGLLPITGIPLPFISNGGSSLLVSMISVAILANISRVTRQQKRLAEETENRLGA